MRALSYVRVRLEELTRGDAAFVGGCCRMVCMHACGPVRTLNRAAMPLSLDQQDALRSIVDCCAVGVLNGHPGDPLHHETILSAGFAISGAPPGMGPHMLADQHVANAYLQRSM